MWGACVVRVYIGLHVGLNTSGVLARFMRFKTPARFKTPSENRQPPTKYYDSLV